MQRTFYLATELPPPVATDDMRSWDRGQPEERSAPSPGTVAKPAIVPAGPWRKIGESQPIKRHHHDRCHQWQPPAIFG